MNNKFTLNDGACQFSMSGCRRNSAHMLPVVDWLCDLPDNIQESDLVEIQFKNTRKGYFRNSTHLNLAKGTRVIVEANPGYDLGEVVLTGALVKKQMQKNHIDTSRYEIRTVIRVATEHDEEKALEARRKEQATMIRARELAKSLGLDMKIGDVEYQGDGSKAIFYYIADGRVDFRQLIKVYAEQFRIRIEMKQIGARQEAGRIGGTGPCGRELCCSTWMTNFVSVSTGAARYQDLSMNPQKLAGQCAKLKCCLNYEVDTYIEAQKHFPSRDIQLETVDNTYYFFKADILAKQISYSTDKVFAANLVTISAERAMDVISMNRKGQKPRCLSEDGAELETAPRADILDENGLTRFDHKKKKKKNRNGGNRQNGSETGAPLAVNPQENKQQDGKSPERGTAVAEERKRNPNHRGNAKHHSNVNENVKKENGAHRVPEGPAKN